MVHDEALVHRFCLFFSRREKNTLLLFKLTLYYYELKLVNMSEGVSDAEEEAWKPLWID